MLKSVVLGTLCVAVAANAAPAVAQSAPHTIVINLVTISPTQYAFQPAQINAQAGDTLKFVQVGTMPHNVQFVKVPQGASLGAAMMGPFLTTSGASYQLVMDGRFAAGSYDFVCTPHRTLGMTGTLSVAPRGGAETVAPSH